MDNTGAMARGALPKLQRVLEFLTALAGASAAVLWAIAVADTLAGKDAAGLLLSGEIVAIACFVLAAIVSRSWIGAACAAVSVPYFLFDGLLRALSGAIGTDGARNLVAIGYYQGRYLSGFPVIGCALMFGLSFALRRRAPIVWAAGSLVAGATLILAILGQDASPLAGAWYLVLAIELARPAPAQARTPGRQPPG